MKMTVKQWALLISKIEEAADKAEKNYQACAKVNAPDDVQKIAWKEYSELSDILWLLRNTQI